MCVLTNSWDIHSSVISALQENVLGLSIQVNEWLGSLLRGCQTFADKISGFEKSSPRGPPAFFGPSAQSSLQLHFSNQMCKKSL
jgi:hypothetical protein